MHRQLLDLDIADRRRLDIFGVAFACNRVHPHPGALDSGKYWRHLIDLAGEVLRDSLEHRGIDRRDWRLAHDFSIAIESVGLDAEFDDTLVNFLTTFEHRRELGRLANHDRQHAGRERIQGAEMADARRL